ncbi:hypothetical protein ABTX85_29325 [Streptomyces sp. NPDC096097]
MAHGERQHGGVRADRAALDPRVHERITRRLREVWPFDAERIDHAPR